MNLTFSPLSHTDYREYDRFDGNRVVFSATAAYFTSARGFVFGGLDRMKEYTRDEAETSVRNSIRVGGAFEWPLGISTRLNLRYARRQFKGQNAYFRYARADREYQSTLSVWHRRLNFWGVTPKFNWQYNKIDSNISDLYSRAAHRVFFSLDKAF